MPLNEILKKSHQSTIISVYEKLSLLMFLLFRLDSDESSQDKLLGMDTKYLDLV